MTNTTGIGFSRLALRYAGIEPGTAADTSHFKVDVKNRITVKHSLGKVRLEAPPSDADKYHFFRPGKAKQHLRHVIAEHEEDPFEFFQKTAPDFLKGTISDEVQEHHSAPLSFKQRKEKVLDRTEIVPCRTCGERGCYEQSRSETTKQTCGVCGGSGGQYVEGYLNQPGTTAHGMPTSKFEMCLGCGGMGTVAGPDRHWVETVTCPKCSGKGLIETNYYRKDKVFWGDTVSSQFTRKTTFEWPEEIRRLIDNGLVSDSDLFDFCEKTSEQHHMDGTDLVIDVSVKLNVDRFHSEYKGNPATVSVLNLEDDEVIFSDKPVLDPYLEKIKTDLNTKSWKEVLDEVETNPFLFEIMEHALQKTAPSEVSKKLGFMTSTAQVGGLLRKIRSIERRRRVILRIVLISLAVLIGYVLIFHFDLVVQIVGGFFT